MTKEIHDILTNQDLIAMHQVRMGQPSPSIITVVVSITTVITIVQRGHLSLITIVITIIGSLSPISLSKTSPIVSHHLHHLHCHHHVSSPPSPSLSPSPSLISHQVPVQGRKARTSIDGTQQIFTKPLNLQQTNPLLQQYGVVMLNRASTIANVTLDFYHDIYYNFLCCPPPVPAVTATIYDMWSHQNVGVFTNTYSVMVPAHGVMVVKVSPKQKTINIVK